MWKVFAVLGLGWLIYGELLNTNRPPAKNRFKFYSTVSNWNDARKACVDAGGHLAVMRNALEVDFVDQLMIDNSATDTWLGYHDQFKEADWVTVTDEPIEKTGWDKWIPGNPDNSGGVQHCARLPQDWKALDDDSCELKKSFVCEIQ